MNARVVITGTGLVSALGTNLSETWNALLAGQCGIGPIEGFDVSGFACRTAARALHLGESVAGIQPRLAEVMGGHLALLVQAAREAFLHAEVDRAAPPEERGFFAGMGMVDYHVSDLLPGVRASLEGPGRFEPGPFYGGGYREIYPLWPLGMLNNVSFCGTCIELDIRGENAVFSPHADSGAWALAEAVYAVAEGRVRVALAGGVSEQVSPLSLARGLLAGTLRMDAESKTGSVLGEGAGMIVVETLDGARERGAKPLAVVSGFGAAFGVEEGDWGKAPSSDALYQAMESALQVAGAAPEDVDLILAHRDGTERADLNETTAIGRLFGQRGGAVPVYASKGALGHLHAASPAVDIVLAVETMHKGIVPGTITAGPPEEGASWRLIQGTPARIRPRRVLINACSYEGQCASLLIEAPDL